MFDKVSRNFANFRRKKSAIFEFKAVQRYVYLVDLEKCFKNEYLVAKIGLDTAENEPSKVCRYQHTYHPPWVISSALWTDPISPWGTYTKYDTTYDTHDTKFPSPLNRPAPRQKPSTRARVLSFENTRKRSASRIGSYCPLFQISRFFPRDVLKLERKFCKKQYCCKCVY